MFFQWFRSQEKNLHQFFGRFENLCILESQDFDLLYVYVNGENWANFFEQHSLWMKHVNVPTTASACVGSILELPSDLFASRITDADSFHGEGKGDEEERWANHWKKKISLAKSTHIQENALYCG